MAVRVTAIKQLQAIVHFHVFREHIVQEQQLTLIQRAVSLVEDADGSGHGRQPSPAAQEGANLQEILEHQKNRAGHSNAALEGNGNVSTCCCTGRGSLTPARTRETEKRRAKWPSRPLLFVIRAVADVPGSRHWQSARKCIG